MDLKKKLSKTRDTPKKKKEKMPPKKAQPKPVPAVPLWATPGGDPESIERTARKKADALQKLQDSQDMCHKRFSLI